jgi:AmiR/NasT family two-component response regulator
MRKACSLSAVQAYLVKPVNEEDLEPVIELAIDRFRQIQNWRHQKRLAGGLETRLDIEQARAYLAASRHCSWSEAQARIEQEARAKRASLDEVARAILADEQIAYRHDAPA